MSFLIVEDDPISCQLLLEVLTPYAYCDSVSTHEQAVEMFQDKMHGDDPYQLIIIDIDLPDGNGIDLLRKIRALEVTENPTDYKPVHALFQTVSDHPDHKTETMSLGSCAYLVKPVRKNLLLDVLELHDLLEV